MPEDDFNLVKRRLYAKDEPEELKRREEELHQLGLTRREQKETTSLGTLAGAKYKNLSLLRSKRMAKWLWFSGLLVLILVITIVAVAGTIFYRSTQTVRESQVRLEIQGPVDFTAGNEIIYTVPYDNNSRVDWVDVELTITPPRGFTYRGSNQTVELAGRRIVLKVGDLASGAAGELHVRGQLIGEQNETAVTRAELLLTPTNFSSGRFSKQAVLATTITALPLDVSLNIPGEAASGERALATVSVSNLSNTVLSGGYLRLLPAPGLELALEDGEFSPGFSELGAEWLLEDLAPLAKTDRTLVFHVDGQPGEKRIIDIEAGIRQEGEDFVQRRLTHVVTLAAAEVVVEQSYNGALSPLTVKAGEQVRAEVKYSNIGDVGLKDVIAKVTFDGSSFDPASLQLGGVGSYDPVTRTISWSSATVPELAVLQPKQEGSLAYSFRILPTESFPTTAETAKNNVLVTTATVDSPDLAVSSGQRKLISDRGVLSVATDLILEATALYDDGRLGIKSTGPVPPVVGQTTSYTLRFRIGSTLNDVAGLNLTAVIPDGVAFTGAQYLTAGEVQTNDRSGEITWTLPFVEGLTGRAKPHQELHVQVQITPGENRRGQAVELLNRVSLTATDQFVDEEVTAALSAFPTTETAAPGAGQVQ